jgi:hypothetical protein
MLFTYLPDNCVLHLVARPGFLEQTSRWVFAVTHGAVELRQDSTVLRPSRADVAHFYETLDLDRHREGRVIFVGQRRYVLGRRSVDDLVPALEVGGIDVELTEELLMRDMAGTWAEHGLEKKWLQRKAALLGLRLDDVLRHAARRYALRSYREAVNANSPRWANRFIGK